MVSGLINAPSNVIYIKNNAIRDELDAVNKAVWIYKEQLTLAQTSNLNMFVNRPELQMEENIQRLFMNLAVHVYVI